MAYFLREDLEALDRKIEELKRKLAAASVRIGEACREGSETHHDNAPYDDAVHEVGLISQRLREFLAIRREAVVVEPSQNTDSVEIGRTVVLEDLETGAIEEIRIGSPSVTSGTIDLSTASYSSPLGRCLMGAKIGNIRVLNLETTKRRLKIVAIK